MINTIPVAIGMPGMGELMVIFFIVLILFGGSRITDIARSCGKGISEFRKAISDSDKRER